jgi:hypothetical protein
MKENNYPEIMRSTESFRLSESEIAVGVQALACASGGHAEAWTPTKRKMPLLRSFGFWWCGGYKDVASTALGRVPFSDKKEQRQNAENYNRIPKTEH